MRIRGGLELLGQLIGKAELLHVSIAIIGSSVGQEGLLIIQRQLETGSHGIGSHRRQMGLIPRCGGVGDVNTANGEDRRG